MWKGGAWGGPQALPTPHPHMLVPRLPFAIETAMKIGIVGAGAMGSLLGFYLCEHADVWLLDMWRAHVDAIEAEGLRCERADAEELRRPRATGDPRVIGACDVILVLVKAHQTPWAAEQARLLVD